MFICEEMYEHTVVHFLTSLPAFGDLAASFPVTRVGNEVLRVDARAVEDDDLAEASD